MSLELRTENAEDWNSYTLTCRVRIKEVSQNYSPVFSASVRSREGLFDVTAEQRMLILPRKDLVAAVTISPDVKIAPKGIEGTIL